MNRYYGIVAIAKAAKTTIHLLTMPCAGAKGFRTNQTKDGPAHASQRPRAEASNLRHDPGGGVKHNHDPGRGAPSLCRYPGCGGVEAPATTGGTGQT